MMILDSGLLLCHPVEFVASRVQSDTTRSFWQAACQIDATCTRSIISGIMTCKFMLMFPKESATVFGACILCLSLFNERMPQADRHSYPNMSCHMTSY